MTKHTPTIRRPRHLDPYTKPTIVDLEPREESKQVEAGTMPASAVELGFKGRSWNKR